MARAEYSEELVDKLCEGITTGMSVAKTCAVNGVSESGFFKWLSKHEYLVEQYARARTIRADHRFETIDEIKDAVRSGEIASDVARVLIDAVKWQTGKENAPRYGDKQQVETRQVDKDGNDVKPRTDEELNNRLAELINKNREAGSSSDT